MPSEHQPRGQDETKYVSDAVQFLQTKPKRMALLIRVHSESEARQWLGACNRLSVSQEVTEHFVNEVQRNSQ